MENERALQKKFWTSERAGYPPRIFARFTMRDAFCRGASSRVGARKQNRARRSGARDLGRTRF